jgi:diaminopimelate epimerase
MLRFVKAHAYGNDFLYVEDALVGDVPRMVLAREMCDRHTGIGADGLILYARTADGATMTLLNADGSPAEVSGNGLRGLAALLLRDEDRDDVTIRTAAGDKRIRRTARSSSQQTFRTAMGPPAGLQSLSLMAGGETLSVVVLNMGNPQCVLLGPLPNDERFRRLGAALEHHTKFPDGTNVEFAHVESPERVRILIWERGCGPTRSSGTGSCASAVAAAAFGGASRDVEIVAPGGPQRVEWLDEGVYLTGWAEIVCDGKWLRELPRVAAGSTQL